MLQGNYNLKDSYYGNTKKAVKFEILTTGYSLTGASAGTATASQTFLYTINYNGYFE